ncbi:hypothetical protein F4775DRAFT_547351 [Biscogniauxia sp. FL1348]|nr:hypothetical protein F4775DRAFT_547351 [Biscogniauxia sp. FL1348]
MMTMLLLLLLLPLLLPHTPAPPSMSFYFRLLSINSIYNFNSTTFFFFCLYLLGVFFI